MLNTKLIRGVILITLLPLTLEIFVHSFDPIVYAQPSISDTALNVEAAVEGLPSPTSMAFLNDNNILVLEKEGSVRLVSNGVLQEEPVLQVPVNTERERGLLGIAVGEDNNTVFLYYTEVDPLRNRVYKYQWNGQLLVNPTLILDLPAVPGPNHDGGKIIIGPDGYLYAVIGDLNHDGQLQNFPDGTSPDDTGVIFRVNPEDGSAAPDNPFVNSGDDLLSKLSSEIFKNKKNNSFIESFSFWISKDSSLLNGHPLDLGDALFLIPIAGSAFMSSSTLNFFLLSYALSPYTYLYRVSWLIPLSGGQTFLYHVHYLLLF
jgi:Glucose / Sorbosone dehydrogenase